jgi:dolichol-phosphate mannosyltransferase
MQVDIDHLLICIPTYNESENILRLIERLRRVDNFHILVIDDNSPDGTANRVLQQNYTNVSILNRPSKSGLGPAYIAGFDWAIQQKYQYVVELDADGSHHPEQLPSLISAIKSCDMVIGTRWMPGGSVENWPVIRKAISRIGTFYAQKVLRLPYRDLTSGYRVISVNALERVNFKKVESLGYGFQIEMALRVHEAGLNIVQVPITFTERIRGKSKMSKRIVIEAFIQTSKWGLQRLLNAR